MPQRLLPRHRTRHVLTMIVLGMCIAAPLPAYSHVCLPPYGCREVQSPKLTTAVAIHEAQSYLAQNPPVVRLRLQKPVGVHPPAAYADLARVALLRKISGQPGQGSGPVYGLPKSWEREIMVGFFRFREVRESDDVAYFIEIPVGTFRYVPGSAVLTLHDVRTGSQPTVTFKYRFIGNANATRLLRIAPPKDWTVMNYVGAQRDLRQLGKISKQALALRPCHAGWLAGRLPLAGPCP